MKNKKLFYGLIGALCIISLLLFLFMILSISGYRFAFFSGTEMSLYLDKDFEEDSGYTINMTDNVKNFLSNHYNESSEYGVCLQMDLTEDMVFNIYDVSHYTKGDEDSLNISEMDCSSVGHLHSHPGNPRICRASNHDILAYQYMIRQDGVIFFMIQCEPERFVIYTAQDLSSRYDYEVSS